MPVKIVQKEDPVLRKKTKEIPLGEINSPKIKKIIKDMREALESQDDGVAIAAPQIGESLSIFIISHRIFDILSASPISHSLTSRDAPFGAGAGPTSLGNRASGDTGKKTKKNKIDKIFINPKLVKVSKEKKEIEEGCLSVRYLYGKVKRAKKATVKALDESGKIFTEGGSGLIAQVFQHEIEHLNGILFIDKARDLKEIPPEKLKK